MDNLTHSLTGLMLSRAGINRSVPRATLLMILAANMPDCDVVSLLAGPEAYLRYHRWLTHSVVMTPLMALLPVLIVRLVYRRERIPWLKAWLASCVGVVTHWLLDYTNSYGVRLWLPFSDAMPSLDISHVVDAWVWAILALAALAPALSRLVSSEIGDSRKTAGRGWAIFALLAILCYDAGRYVLHARAVSVQQGRIYGVGVVGRGEPPLRAMAYPTPFNPLEWRGVIETESLWAIHPVHLAREFDPLTSRFLYKPAPSAAMESARRTEAFHAMTEFSPVLHWRTTPSPDAEGAVQVQAVDLRLGFTATAIIDGQGRALESSLTY